MPRNAQGSGWVDFHGNESPVPPDQIISVRFADGSEIWNTQASKVEHEWQGGIVAFRVAEKD